MRRCRVDEKNGEDQTLLVRGRPRLRKPHPNKKRGTFIQRSEVLGLTYIYKINAHVLRAFALSL